MLGDGAKVLPYSHGGDRTEDMLDLAALGCALEMSLMFMRFEVKK